MNRKISYKIKSNKLNILGEVEGSLIGGNLSVLCATLGTNYQPEFENKILFIEDIDEYYYKIDRMIWQLKYAGVFHQISGLIIGHFTNLKDNSISFGMSLEEIILEKLNEFNFPVIFDFPAGHENENLAIPFGMKLKLEAKDEYVKLYA
jgi:muramoyltetrapeptide carboxypeptidase